MLSALAGIAAPLPLAAQSFDLLGAKPATSEPTSGAKPAEKKAPKPKPAAKPSPTPESVAPTPAAAPPAPTASASIAPAAAAPVTPAPSPSADDPVVVPEADASKDAAVELGQESWWPLELAAALTALLLLGVAAIRLQLGARLAEWREERQEKLAARRDAKAEANRAKSAAKAQAAADRQERAEARYREIRKPVAPAAIQPAPLPVLAEDEAPDARLAALREQFIAARDTGQSPIDITIDDMAIEVAPEPLEDEEEDADSVEHVEEEASFRPSPLFASLTEAPIPAPPPPVADVEPWTESESTAAIPDLPVRALTVALMPTRFTTSLTQAALRYKLTLHNRAKEPLGPIMLLAALADPDGDAVGPEDVHSHAMLRAGGKVEFSGELKMPLAEVSPILLGGAELFVPMVQVAIEASRSGALARFAPYRTEAGFLVGKAQDDGDGKTLAPIRLDAGPVNLDDLAQRAMNLEKPQKHQTKV